MKIERIIMSVETELIICKYHLDSGNKSRAEMSLRRIRKLIPTEPFDLRKATKGKD